MTSKDDEQKAGIERLAPRMLEILDELVAEFDVADAEEWEQNNAYLPEPASVKMARDILREAWGTEDGPVWDGWRWLVTYAEIKAYYEKGE